MTRRTALTVGAICLAVAVVLAVLVALVPGAVDRVDEAWNAVMGRWRTPGLVDFALVMNVLGGGWVATFVVPIGIAVLAFLFRGWRAAVYAVIAFVASAGVVQGIKRLLGRARPEDLIVPSDFGSFPSGHTSNAATIALVLWVLFPSVVSAIGGALWIIAMAFSRTILSVHWASDTVGGALVGAGIALLVAAVLQSWLGVLADAGEGQGPADGPGASEGGSVGGGADPRPSGAAAR